MILSKTIDRLKELYLMLVGYGETIENMPTVSIQAEHNFFLKVLPTYKKLSTYLDKLEQKDKLLIEFTEVIKHVTFKMESIEATLEIYSEASDRADLLDARNDLQQNIKENFSAWAFTK